MPAIQIERLVQQISSILAPASPGPIFRENFKSLLEVHANLAYRAGMEIQRKSLIPKYHLAPIVIHQIQHHLILFTKNNPELALEYADHLWGENLFEMKYFSAVILGSMPNEKEEEVLKRFLNWGPITTEKEIYEILFRYGSQSFIQASSNKWLNTIQAWIDSSQTTQVITAIYALQSLIHDPSFQNLPRVFKIITPLFSINNRKITSGILILIEDLAEINPVETAHYLSYLLLTSSSTNPKKIIRKSLKSFPIAEQEKLRIALSNAPED